MDLYFDYVQEISKRQKRIQLKNSKNKVHLSVEKKISKKDKSDKICFWCGELKKRCVCFV